MEIIKINIKTLLELTAKNKINKKTLIINGYLDESNNVDSLEIKFSFDKTKDIYSYKIKNDDFSIKTQKKIDKSLDIFQQIFNKQKLNIDLDYEIEKDYNLKLKPNQNKFNIINDINFDDIRFIDGINYSNKELSLKEILKSDIKKINNYSDYGFSI